ncbi:hypothetical protein Ancab_024260 [Ancistrocladus abbreviatus]
MEDIQPPNNHPTQPTNTASLHLQHIKNINDATAIDDTILSPHSEDYYIDSNCSTPYVSAPSSPGRAPGSCGGGFYYSAPTSPMHFVLLSARSSSFATNYVPLPSDASSTGTSGSFEFEFSARFANNSIGSASSEIGSMSSADELFLNGQIRPMKLSTHLQRPQVLAPLPDIGDDGDCRDDDTGRAEAQEKDGADVFQRCREMRLRDKSLRRRTRSLSPLRSTTLLDWGELVAREEGIGGRVKKTLLTTTEAMDDDERETKGGGGAETTTSNETTPSVSASSSRSSSAGRSSKRWVFLKDFLRSKSEGRSSNGKFWSNISFSPAKEKKTCSTMATPSTPPSTSSSGNDPKEKINVCPFMESQKMKKTGKEGGKRSPASKPTNGVGKRRVPPSPHELHYTANRARAEEMRKKTYLPYRQGLLGCLGFSSKSYGAMNGFARVLNPVSSR